MLCCGLGSGLNWDCAVSMACMMCEAAVGVSGGFVLGFGVSILFCGWRGLGELSLACWHVHVYAVCLLVDCRKVAANRRCLVC